MKIMHQKSQQVERHKNGWKNANRHTVMGQDTRTWWLNWIKQIYGRRNMQKTTKNQWKHIATGKEREKQRSASLSVAHPCTVTWRNREEAFRLPTACTCWTFRGTHPLIRAPCINQTLNQCFSALLDLMREIVGHGSIGECIEEQFHDCKSAHFIILRLMRRLARAVQILQHGAAHIKANNTRFLRKPGKEKDSKDNKITQDRREKWRWNEARAVQILQHRTNRIKTNYRRFLRRPGKENEGRETIIGEKQKEKWVK